jgi:hypothetical protein
VRRGNESSQVKLLHKNFQEHGMWVDDGGPVSLSTLPSKESGFGEMATWSKGHWKPWHLFSSSAVTFTKVSFSRDQVLGFWLPSETFSFTYCLPHLPTSHNPPKCLSKTILGAGPVPKLSLYFQTLGVWEAFWNQSAICCMLFWELRKEIFALNDQQPPSGISGPWKCEGSEDLPRNSLQ